MSPSFFLRLKSMLGLGLALKWDVVQCLNANSSFPKEPHVGFTPASPLLLLNLLSGCCAGFCTPSVS